MTTVTQTQTVAQFDHALRTLAARAKTRYPDEQARIDRGLVLALNGHVTLHADGTARVQSGSDAEVVYTVNGCCDCADAQRAPAGKCKHRYAKALVKRALQPTHTRVAYHATYQGQHGQAIRDEFGSVYFHGDDDQMTPLFDTDAPALLLAGRVDLAADQRRRDLEAQTDLARIETRHTEAAILAA